MNNVIEALHKVGIKVLMDDFGTGYSSMMMLKNVAIDVLKLDKSFVDDIGDDRSEKIISNIIYLAHSLQIEVTAEGVETAAQFEFLKSVGCDYIQGYYFGKPQPAEDFAALLQKNFMMEVMRVLIRKAELQDVRAVYALICELEEQDLPLLEFENIFGSLLKLPEHFS